MFSRDQRLLGFSRHDGLDLLPKINDNAIAINARFVHPRENPSAVIAKIGPENETITARTKHKPAKAMSTFVTFAIIHLLACIVFTNERTTDAIVISDTIQYALSEPFSVQSVVPSCVPPVF